MPICFFPILHVLAQDVPATMPVNPNDARLRVFWSLGILLIIIVIGFVAIMLFRRKLTTPPAPTQDVGFSLSGLREMRDRGEITDEEYEATKAKVIAKIKSAANEPPKPKTKPRLDDEF